MKGDYSFTAVWLFTELMVLQQKFKANGDRKNIAIIQPMVAHYRREFYELLGKQHEIDSYSWMGDSESAKEGFEATASRCRKLKGIKLGPMIFYSFFPFLCGKYDVIVLVQEMKYISHWPILLLARFWGKKVVLWGHGITVAKYHKHCAKMPLSRKLMFLLSDCAWFYTATERAIWRNLLPSLKSVSLGNTISGVNRVLNLDIETNQTSLRDKYSITQKIVLIFCARFNTSHRRVDLLVRLLETLNPDKYGLIVIGDGAIKPDFSRYRNVYDFGSSYDEDLKDRLFATADIYYQPAWLGLSIVEAMAYGKPVFTLKRSEEILQGVEYGYIQSGHNGMIFENFKALADCIQNVDIRSVKQLGANARQFVQDNLTMESMVNNAVAGIEQVL